MKLKFTKKKRAFFADKRDAAKKDIIKKRLEAVSADQRLKQLVQASEPPPPPSDNLKIKITQKGGGLLNKGSSALGIPQIKSELQWKARSMIGRHLPNMQCNTCTMSRTCPKFKAGHECAFIPYLNSHKIESLDDLKSYMRLMAANSMKRAQKMVMFEEASGAAPSVETSESLDLAFKQLTELYKLFTESEEQTVEIEGNSKTIIGQIFGGMKIQKVVAATEDILRNDPIALLPPVPVADSDVRKPSSSPDVIDELVKEAIISQGNTSGGDVNSARSGLPKGPITEIQQSTLG